jgi:hypothetical protein
LYLCGGRDVASATVQRARDAGYSALILTITAVAGLRDVLAQRRYERREPVDDAAVHRPGPSLGLQGWPPSSATAA